MPKDEFFKKTVEEGLEYATRVNYNNQTIDISFEDGSIAKFSFDEWEKMLNSAFSIVSINCDIIENSGGD